jgi:nitroreductase
VDDISKSAILNAISGRRSVRGFLTTPVAEETVRQILEVASRAPSGSNTQGWQVEVLTGAAKARLTAAIMAARADGGPEPAPEYPYYPAKWFEPFHGRRRELGWSLYDLLSISKGDRSGARAWHDRNFSFFGAPVGMILTMDRRLAQGALMDCAMFLQNVTIAARAFGLETCPQAAFASYYDIIRRELSLSEERLIICGLALGHEDTQAVANKLRSSRVAVDVFATFRKN